MLALTVAVIRMGRPRNTLSKAALVALAQALRWVLIKILPMLTSAASVEPPLNPIQPNQRMNPQYDQAQIMSRNGA